jgi:hypothetical protein
VFITEVPITKLCLDETVVRGNSRRVFLVDVTWCHVLAQKAFLPSPKSVRKIDSIPKSLARRMQWGPAAVGMEATFPLSAAKYDSTNV